jgi:hypothetical protein
MAKSSFGARAVVVFGLVSLALGATGWVVASATTSADSTSTDNGVTSNVAPYPAGMTTPSGKAPLPSARTALPETPAGNSGNPPTPELSEAPAGLSNSVAACGGAAFCQIQGITTNHQAPFSSQDFEVSNEYSGTYSEQSVTVYAGEEMSAPSTSSNSSPAAAGGGLRVLLANGSQQNYPAPSGTTELTITSVSGSVVSLQDQAGTPLTFSLSSDSYS